jgi:propionate CoA-transferase
LVEVAPGIDIERDILAHMEFQPIVNQPRLMNEAIFKPGSMGMIRTLLRLDLDGRITYDAERQVLFLDFEALVVRRREDVDRIRQAVEARVRPLGHKVAAVINYDHADIGDEVVDAYAEMTRYMEANWYTTVSRYATDAFKLMKLGRSMLHAVPTRVFSAPAEPASGPASQPNRKA